MRAALAFPWLRTGLEGAVVVVAAAFAYGFFSEYWLTILTFAAIYSLPALALLLFLGYAGQPSFGHAAFFALGAYATAILTTRFSWSPLAAFPIGMVVSGAAAYAIGVPLLRVRGHYLAIATLAFAIIVQVLLVYFQDWTGGAIGIPGIPALGNTRESFAVAAAVAVLAYVASAAATRTRIGVLLRALGDDEIATASCGISPAAIRTGIFVGSAVLASVGGSLYAQYLSYVSPEPFNVDLSVLFVTMMLIGGVGNPWGGLVGAVTVGLIPNLISEYANYAGLLYGIAILLALFFLPRGLLGLAVGIVARLRGGRQSHSLGPRGIAWVAKGDR